MKTVFLASVPHTGTQFTRAFLNEALGEVNEITTSALIGSRDQRYRREGSGDTLAETAGLDPQRTNLVYGHLVRDHMPTLLALAAHVPTVVPVRDPLASVISREVRNTHERPHETQFAAWQEFPKMMAWKPAMVCIDRPSLRFLLEMAAQVVNPQYPIAVAERWRENWPRYNESAPHPLKEAYAAGDRRAVERGLGPQVWRMLRGLEDELRPVLESFGYRALLWWS